MKTDKPVKNKEEDLLGRYEFAEDIVNGLLSNFETGQNSFTIGVNGEWGTGKSSILEFIETEIRNKTQKEVERNIIYRFNPWLFSGQADLQRSFLTHLGIQLRTINPSLQKLGEDIILFSNLIEAANVFNPEFVSKSAIGVSMKFIEKTIRRITTKPSLEELKNRINYVLESSKIKVFIIIDDIDRLISSEIAEIFRLVNLNASFKNTFFFLAYDRRVVADSISNEFSLNGEHFLEKIIQLDYTLPKPTANTIWELFFDSFSRFSGRYGKSFDDKELIAFWNNGLDDYFKNIRHIYRYFNSLELRFQTIMKDVSIMDFAIIEAIRIFDYDAFEWMYRSKSSLVYNSVGSSVMRTISQEDEDQNIKELIDSISEAQECTKKLINFLFRINHLPSLSISIGEIDKDKLEKEKRIAHEDYFDHYFAFKVAESNIPEATIDFFVNNPEKRDEIFKRYIGSMLANFLKRVSYRLSEEASDEMVSFIFDASDRENLHLRYDKKSGLYNLFAIIDFLDKVANRFGYRRYIQEILTNNNSYSRFYVQALLRNKLSGNTDTILMNNFPNELLKENEKNIQDSYYGSLTYFANKYLSDPIKYPLYIIYDLLMHLYNDKPKNYRTVKDDYLTDIEKTLILFRCSLKEAHDGKNSYYALDSNKYMLPELKIDDLDQMLGNVDPHKYEGETRKYILVFQKLKEKKFNPNKYYSLNLEEFEG